MATTIHTRVSKIVPAYLLLIALFFAVVFLSPCTASGVVWYVSGDVGISGTGASWSTAFMTIQEAASSASEGDEIWVKEGTYPLSSTITVTKAINLYGGFAGSETQRDERDWTTNITTIDGQNSTYHCLYVAADVTIDGFTLTGGNADGESPDHRGGGLYIYYSSPTITNCTFTDNTANYGGAIYNRNSSPTITNCTFTGNNAITSGSGMYNFESSPTITTCTFSTNSANYGGGIFNDTSSPTITNCTFTANTVTTSGGGMYNHNNSSPTITTCTFTANSVTASGGGMYNHESSPTITTCTFSTNSANYGGGIFNDTSSPTITTCTIYGNSATNYGGAIRNYGASTPTITTCILWENTAPDGPEIYNDDTSTPTITFCDIQRGYNGTGNINEDPLLVDPEHSDFHLTAPSPCIDAGDNSASALSFSDFEDDSRIIDGNNDGTATVDMGADEYILSVTADGDLAPLGNRDGMLNVGDALVCLRFSLGLETPTQEDIVHGDVAPLDAQGCPTPDGAITVGDALVILRNALGLISWESVAAGASGMWSIYTTPTGQTQEEGPIITLLLQSGTSLTLEIITLDTASTNGTGTITGTQISLSWEEAEKTVFLTGTVSADSMSGTWTDTSGGSGTWRAELSLELGEAQITSPQTGSALVVVDVEGGIGSATIYGTETDQGPAFPLTGFTLTTPEGDCVVTLDDQERPLTMTMGTMEITYTYNLDESFNYEMREDGVLLYSGSALSVGNENTGKSLRSSREESNIFSGDSGNETGLSLVPNSSRDSTALEHLDYAVRDLLFRVIRLRYKITDPNDQFVMQVYQNAVIVHAIRTVLMNDALTDRLIQAGTDSLNNIADLINSFSRIMATNAFNLIDQEYDTYNGGDNYDLDKDGYTENNGDCNDFNDDIHPGAEERCNGINDDCDDDIDEGAVDGITYYTDFDEDGYGDPSRSLTCCPPAPSGYVADNTDCDDGDKNKFPGQVWVKDADGDGYTDGNFMKSCTRPEGYKLPGELKDAGLIDCADSDPSRYPGAPEICDDSIDQDCDGNDTPCSCEAGTKGCNGGCIPDDRVCCHGQGYDCPSGNVCLNNDCCPAERVCDGIKCCNEGYHCCNDGGGHSCPNGTTCCIDAQCCCPTGYKCCPPFGCCPVEDECCGDKCCKPGFHCVGGECVSD